ncbi:MAG: hypothetical protein Q8P13_03150 [bacterium]|nr:hypothetical protein [bacterium]
MGKSRVEIPQVDLGLVRFLYRSSNAGRFEFAGGVYHYWAVVLERSLTWRRLQRIHASGQWSLLATHQHVGYAGRLVPLPFGRLGICLEARTPSRGNDVAAFEQLLENFGQPVH